MKERILVSYFSASGVTKAAAEKLAAFVGADIFEIKPKVSYTDADLNWRDKNSRSSIEMNDESSRPAIVETVKNPQNYDTILIGFPVWWYSAPTIINTFIESADFKGKNIALFCTSGGTGVEGCEKKLKQTYGSQFVWKKGRRFISNISENDIIQWTNELGIQ